MHAGKTIFSASRKLCARELKMKCSITEKQLFARIVTLRCVHNTWNGNILCVRLGVAKKLLFHIYGGNSYVINTQLR